MTRFTRSQDPQKAFQQFAHDQAKRSWRLAYGLMRNSADADDLLQHSYLQVANKVDQIPAGDPWPWFATIITNCARNAWRKTARRGEASLDQSLEGNSAMEPAEKHSQDPHEMASRAELGEELREALLQLPDEEREVLMLTYVSELSQSQAAEALDLPLGTVKSRARRGLEKLRSKFGKGEPELAKALCAIPFVAPPMGFEQAISGWISAGQAAIASGAAATGATSALATGGAIMTNKTMVALTIGFAVSLSVISSAVITGMIKGSEIEDLETRVLDLKQERETLKKENLEALELRQRQLDQAESNFKRVQESMSELAKEKVELNNRILDIQTEKDGKIRELQESLAAAKKTVADELNVSSEKALNDAIRGGELLSQIKTGVQAKDKDQVMKAMRELVKLGKGAYPAYFEAFDLALRHGNAWVPHENPLNLTMSEFIELAGPNQIDYALKNKDVPSSARTYSVYSLPYATGYTPEEKGKLLIGVKETVDDPVLGMAVAVGLTQIQDDSVIPHLHDVTEDSKYGVEGRGIALSTLATREASKADWGRISALAEDKDTTIAGYATYFVEKRSPSVSGFLIADIKDANQQANPAQNPLQNWVTVPVPPAFSKLSVGDVVTRFDGKEIRDAQELKRAMAAAKEGDRVLVDFVRNGVAKSEMLEASKYRLSGEVIVKSED